jgi:hypothetical protein
VLQAFLNHGCILQTHISQSEIWAPAPVFVAGMREAGSSTSAAPSVGMTLLSFKEERRILVPDERLFYR